MLFRYVILILIILPFTLNAQTTGDFRSVGTGNWGTSGTWERYSSGGVWQASGIGENNPGQVPTNAATTITVQGGHNVTVAAPATSKALVVNGTLTLGTQTVNATTFAISGTGTITISTGTITAGDITSSTITASGAATINCAGLWNVTNFTASTSSVIFTGTANVNSANTFSTFRVNAGVRTLATSTDRKSVV